MKPIERFQAFWAGEKPDVIPLSIYGFFCGQVPRDPAWTDLFERGLVPTWGCGTFKSTTRDLEYVNDSFEENGRTYGRSTMKTPVGRIFTTYLAGWRQKPWLTTAEDYRVMTWIAEHTEITPDTSYFDQFTKEVAPHGLVFPAIGRTPIQTILVDYTGLEQFAYHLEDFEDELMTLYEALLRNFRKVVEITADGPGKYVSSLENFTAETMGPARFERFHMPVYRECFPVLHQAGKIVGTHYDGKLASVKQQIANAPMDLIESLTTPPEGDMSLTECRAAWPKKLFWSNINVSSFDLPRADIKAVIRDMIRQAAPDGRRLAFEISEDLPHNWKESVGVVIEALHEAAGT